MKLQPVYLLAPEPEPKSMTSRRAFLLAGCTFATGTLIGGACGYSLGASRGSGEPEDPKKVGSNDEVELKSTGDATLDELRRLAVKAPIDELRKKANWWFSMRGRNYLSDGVLWRGIDRMSEEVTTNSEHGFHEFDIVLLIGSIKRGNRPESRALEHRLKALEKAREALKTKSRAKKGK